ncbi:precorrin-2 dehydrogenase/sirohydrochlorin ferrochelatase family protein [Romboutsia hominis]|uniref:precorrin-2 dehydrogenase n=1 Tax=Romboutsia hominis TaxID=1507512 RepID=A0A2P2BUQ2_9FIRM|nr:bifunctional precorrin-2 dehydrogenase/sirohydrochlorin ferrochelatase [Romboutsia hominis]MCH1959090.1 bifunctional precorrin-2 dehydrogenase/sirohydrochlorin ferrochelatase [Romboutsia hominis]MCH1968210.1 bifunctional precorrin-2 dehydrogenase/sirohydrochlorin ferrochelatase [Romboutsia hominis]CEI74096.1 Siroheme synthase, N-terminal domain protein [Romboutsia hominis]
MLYPINIDISDIKITVIGGGEVAYRKCKNFLAFGKTVKVISKDYINKFGELKDKLEIVNDEYKEEYLKDSFIVVAATNNKEVNRKIGIYCRENGKLVNVVDDIELSNFTVPSYVKRGDLLISISTGGKSPSLSSKIKKELEEKYDDSYEEYIDTLGELRKEIIKKYEDVSLRRKKLKALINLDLAELRELKIEYQK